MAKPLAASEVSFYRAFTISPAGVFWRWQHEDCDGDHRYGHTLSRDAAFEAVDRWYEARHGCVPAMSRAEFLAIAAILFVGGIAIYLALAARVGGFGS